ncbi:IclR family transcriptional regulator [Streptomyces sp. NPDC059999]|uniref:IclR family transcriptional regulator n=1 Tax=unclassified Streptomyces TaxID=2593676 RepID=UPI002E3311F9|nr:helix-turn-helix domain-containing protein [Streptomyces sp. NBC_01426]
MSGVGVLDKASVLLDIVESRPATLVQLVAHSGLSRPTTYRIAVALERLGLLTRDPQGRFVLGPRLGLLAVEARGDRLAQVCGPVLAELSERTGLDARLYRRRGRLQMCVASSVDRGDAPEAGAVGTARPATAGPAAQVLLAWEEPEELYEGLVRARFTAAHLALVRHRGWAYGPDPVAPGTVSYAVPVRGAGGGTTAALVLSGPAARMPRVPGRALTGSGTDAAVALGDALLRTRGDLIPAGATGS